MAARSTSRRVRSATFLASVGSVEQRCDLPNVQIHRLTSALADDAPNSVTASSDAQAHG